METNYVLLLDYLSSLTSVIRVEEIHINGMDDDLIATTANDLQEKNLVHSFTSGIAINENGRDYLIKHKHNLLPKSDASINIGQIGHNFGDIHGSRLNIDTNLNTTNTNIKNAAKPAKKSWYEISMWIFTAIAVIIAVWEFWLKHIVFK